MAKRDENEIRVNLENGIKKEDKGGEMNNRACKDSRRYPSGVRGWLEKKINLYFISMGIIVCGVL